MLRQIKKIFPRRFAQRLIVGLALGVLIFGVAGLQPEMASAAALPNNTCGTFDLSCKLGYAIGSILQVIQQALAWLITLLADGTIVLINYGVKMLDFPAVQAGFRVCLGVVNLIFVMALIVISFKIILDINSGEAKKGLVKVIMAAILVNFSFLIAGLLLDVSNVFTTFFANTVTSKNIYVALNPNLFETIPNSAFTNSDAGPGFWNIIIPQLASLLFTALILIIMLAVFATTFVRNLRVACLLLVMPLTWGMWVFPGLEKHHKEWWESFMKWGVTMLPTMMFFMYLAITAASKMSTIDVRNTLPRSQWPIFDSILNILIIGGIMVAGLKISQEAGGISASAALGATKSAAGYAAKIPGVGMARRATERGLFKPAAGKFATFASDMAGSGEAGWKGGAKRILGKSLLMSGAAKTAADYSHMAHQIDDVMKKEYGDNKDVLSSVQTVNVAMAAKTDIGKAEAYAALKRKGEGAFKEILSRKGGAEKLAGLMEAYGGYTHNSAKDLIKESSDLKKVLGYSPEKAAEVQKSFNDKEQNGPGKTGIGESALENYLKMKSNDGREINMKKKYEEDPAAAMAMVLALPKSTLVATAQVNGENEMYARITLAASFAQDLKNKDSGNLKSMGEELDTIVKTQFTKIKDIKDPDERLDAMAKVTSDINKVYERTKGELGGDEGLKNSTNARLATIIDKNDRLNRITSSFTEWSGGGDDKK